MVVNRILSVSLVIFFCFLVGYAWADSLIIDTTSGFPAIGIYASFLANPSGLAKIGAEIKWQEFSECIFCKRLDNSGDIVDRLTCIEFGFKKFAKDWLIKMSVTTLSFGNDENIILWFLVKSSKLLVVLILGLNLNILWNRSS